MKLEPDTSGTHLRLHRAADEACYVLKGTFGFQVNGRPCLLELTERR
jgi:uncharacterized cupin superfamily protein